MSFSRRSLLPFLAASLLVGCAATVNRPSADTSQISPSISASKRIVLTLSGVNGFDSGPNWDAFKEEWQTSMTAATAAAGSSFTLAEHGDAVPTAPATLVKVRVNDFRYVSQAKRYTVGVFAGNAYMDLDVEFLETPSGRTLGMRKYSTSSSAWHGIFSAMTPKQVEAVSQEIVKEIVRK
ncbi:MAG: DUF4410 domain-containing protein [Leptothrix sp. (in: b-proteobacteria)]